jgi:hypothetical protein
MSITNSREFKETIDLAIAGNKYILRDIAKYVLYNYNLCMHIKEGGPDDLKNGKLYKALEKGHPEIFAGIEGWVNYEITGMKDYIQILTTRVEH